MIEALPPGAFGSAVTGIHANMAHRACKARFWRWVRSPPPLPTSFLLVSKGAVDGLLGEWSGAGVFLGLLLVYKDIPVVFAQPVDPHRGGVRKVCIVLHDGQGHRDRGHVALRGVAEKGRIVRGVKPEFPEFGGFEEHAQKDFWRHAGGQIPLVGILC